MVVFSFLLGKYKGAGLWGHVRSVCLDLHTNTRLFHIVTTVLHSHQQYVKDPKSMHPHQHLHLSIVLTVATLLDTLGLNILFRKKNDYFKQDLPAFSSIR